MLIDIAIEFDAWSNTRGLEDLIVTAANAAVFEREDEFKDRAELSVLLTSDDAIQHLNLKYRGQNKPTNVLSFCGESDVQWQARSFLLGDIVLSYQTINTQAGQQRKSFENHVSHLVVHGVLHLLGYNHEGDKDAGDMELVEVNILKGIGIGNPYSQSH